MLVQLPNGLIDGSDHFTHVEIGELLGKHQNYLADKELIDNNIGHIEKLISELVLSVQTPQGLKWKGDKKELPWKLTASDIETILIKIRENTYGGSYYFDANCIHCEKLNKDIKVDLSKLEMEHISLEEILTPKVVMLPKAQKEAEMKPLYLNDFFEILKVTKGTGKTLFTSIASLVVKRIGDNSNITEKDIGELSVKDIKCLQESTEKMKLEGTIDSEVEHTCKHCSKDFNTKLNVFHPSFFDPSRDTPT